MFNALNLLTTLCAGFPIIHEPQWNLQPEVFVAPAAPKAELALLQSDTIRFVRFYEADSTSDTAFIGWNAIGKSLVEEHAYSEPQWFLENTATRIVLGNVDLEANHKGFALAGSEEEWHFQEGVWNQRGSFSKRDSSGVAVYEMRTRTFFGDEWVQQRIREGRHASGFISWRDTSILRDTGWATTSRDEIERSSDGAPISALKWRVIDNALVPAMRFGYWWEDGKLVRSSESTAEGEGEVQTKYVRGATGELLSKVDSGQGYMARLDWKRDVSGHVVEELSTSRYEYGSSVSTSMVRRSYTYDANGMFRRMDIANKNTDTGAWSDVERELYTWDSKGRLTGISSVLLCTDFESASCKYSTTRITWIDSPWRVGVRKQSGSRSTPWRTFIRNGSFVFQASESTPVTLEILRLDGTRLVSMTGKGRSTTVDLRQWKSTPLVWRARIGGSSASGSITIP